MSVFSATVLEHFRDPRHTRPLETPTATGWSGDTAAYRYMRIQIAVVDGVVRDASFGTFGCAAAIAAGSRLCEWAVGRTVEETARLTADRLDGLLGGLPPARRFCADLAVDAWHDAIRTYRNGGSS